MSPRGWALATAASSFAVFLFLAGVFWIEDTAERDSTGHAWSIAAGVLAGPLVLPLLVVVTAAGLGARGRIPAARFLLVAVGGAGVVMYASRILLQIVGADEDGGRLSDYPSGHATAVTAVVAAALATVFAETRRRSVRALTVLGGILAIAGTALARLDAGAHAPIDVAGGIALGLAWTALCVVVLPPSGERAPTTTAWLVGFVVAGVIGFVLVAVAQAHEPLASLDDDAAEWVATSAPGWAQDLARPFSWIGGWLGLTFLVVMATGVLVRERAPVDIVFLLTAVLGSQVVVALLKAFFDRARPDVGSAVPLPDSAAFPSGHATAGVAAFGALAVLVSERLTSSRARIVLWVSAVVLALGIGISRVALNVHFVTDVLAGWCLGLAWLAACLLGREWLRQRG